MALEEPDKEDEQVASQNQEVSEVEKNQESAVKQVDVTKKEFSGVKTTLFRNPADGTQWPIPVSMSPMPTVDRILTYVDRTGFCGILCIGMSGTGKSTLAKYLVHQIHQKRNFIVHWYERDDIQNLDKEIKHLQVGASHIMVFDDASFSLEQLKREQINKIAQNLTYVRHDVRGQVIIIMNIHYSKAISRFFRNVPFAFLTSISQEEVHSFVDVWPHGRWKFKDFAWYYQQMMFNSKWVFEVDRWTNKTITYRTDEPFRLGLAMEGNYIHFFVYLKDGCTACDPDYNIKKLANSKDLVDHFIKSYGVNRARSMLKLYAFARHGKKAIDSNRYAIWKSISEYDKNNRINWDNVIGELNKTLKVRRRVYLKKDHMTEQAQALEQLPAGDPEVERIKTEQEIEFAQQLEEQLAELQENQDKVIPMGYDPETSNPATMPYGEEDIEGQLDQDGIVPEGESSDTI